MKKLALNLLFATMILFAAESVALACVCFLHPGKSMTNEEVKKTVKEDFDKSLAVFTGEVIEIDKFKVKFKVENAWKGAVGDEIVMSTGTRDLGNGMTTDSSCDFHFQKGKKYLVAGFGKNYEEIQGFDCTITNLIKNSALQIEFLNEIVPPEKRNVKISAKENKE